MMTTTIPMTTKHERTCVGCRQKAAAGALVRLVVGPVRTLEQGESSDRRDAGVAVDAAGGAFGRGVHVHPSLDCVARACRGGLSAAAKREVRADASVVCQEIREAYERRAAGLILGARRARHLAIGADAAAEAVEKGAPMVVLSTDAGADVRKRFSRASLVHAFGTKASLGAMLGTGETAVFAVCHDGVSKALSEALYVATAVSAARSSEASVRTQTKTSGSEER
ncbi:MAG TPA: YlxR family protein [Polyangiaceae bacterium]|nr:YlxR family protein [Polyangiaceae bacterium]